MDEIGLWFEDTVYLTGMQIVVETRCVGLLPDEDATFYYFVTEVYYLSGKGDITYRHKHYQYESNTKETARRFHAQVLKEDGNGREPGTAVD